MSAIPLKYKISSSSPHSVKYVPENIIEDKPMDQASRWSGAFQANGVQNQWITLELESLSVLKTITFGKFSKPHPCNMKELKVFVGATTDHMLQVLHTGLKNDTIPETFTLSSVNAAGFTFPTRYVKIVPLMAHQQSFHVSVWYVGLTGIADPDYVEQVRLAYENYRETTVMRYVLKHLRQRNLLAPFQEILSRYDFKFEHPLVTQLHDSIVLQADWTNSEQLLNQLLSAKLFDSYLQNCPSYSEWARLSATDEAVPPARGGHAMCIDPMNEIVYIFGGWDGERSLDDFWAYNIRQDKWKILSHSTTHEPNAPGARSCHKMVFDTKTGSIYVLGRLSDSDALREPSPVGVQSRTVAHDLEAPSLERRRWAPSPPETKTYFSEFYRYHTRGVLSGKWDFLSMDTSVSDGPPLVYDHQMVMDSATQMIYVFGGRVVDGDWNGTKFSGLYSYNVSTSKWTLLQESASNSWTTDESTGSLIPPRYGHSMVLDDITKVLYIFAGQRDDKYLSDMYTYDIKTGNVCEVFSNFSLDGGPEACFTPRAVIDTALKEIYVVCGLTKVNGVNSPNRSSKAILKDRMHNWVYKYDSQPGRWSQILKIPEQSATQRPMPRFAHQVVYNSKTKAIYMHGGNGGESNTEEQEMKDNPTKGRLNDFWKMQLQRLEPEEIIRQCKFAIRKQQFKEMCEGQPPLKSLAFLQKDVASVVDHQNRSEEEQFRSLLTHLLSAPTTLSSTHEPSSSSGTPLEHEDTREGSCRPRKRSRSDRDSEDKPSSGEDYSSLFAGSAEPSFNLISDGQDTTGPTTRPHRARSREKDSEKNLSTRYTQRTEVFESLLRFVNDAGKQPDDDLFDVLESDRGLKTSALV